MATVKFTTRDSFGELTADMRAQLSATLSKRWAARWMAFIRRRFDQFSKGGGDWPPLAESTRNARRFSRGGTVGQARARAQRSLLKAQQAAARATNATGRSKATQRLRKARESIRRASVAAGSAAILRDTGTLFRATQPGAPGNRFEATARGFRAGFAPAGHPKGATISQIAAWHQRGVPGKFPARPILVPPDSTVTAGMAQDAKEVVGKIVQQAARGGGRRKR